MIINISTTIIISSKLILTKLHNTMTWTLYSRTIQLFPPSTVIRNKYNSD